MWGQLNNTMRMRIWIKSMTGQVPAMAAVVCMLVGLLAGAGPAASGDSPLFTVTGVRVDVRDKDAASAKLKGFSEAQVKAFRKLVIRLGDESAARRLNKLTPGQIGRMLSSMSVERESSGPRRYVATLTVKFLAEKVRQALANAGVSYTEEQSPAIVIVPLWMGPDGPVVWQDNPWRNAWLGLKAENSMVPVIIPLGDLTDTQAITAAQVAANDVTRLEAIRMRYNADAILVAIAQPVPENAVKASMTGKSPVGRILFSKTYVAKQGGIAQAALIAARRFHTVMLFKWKKSSGRSSVAAVKVQSLPVAVPFSSIAEWNSIRARLMATPGVSSVDISNLSARGAVIRLGYAVALEKLQGALGARSLSLNVVGGTWVLQPF